MPADRPPFAVLFASDAELDAVARMLAALTPEKRAELMEIPEVAAAMQKVIVTIGPMEARLL